MVVETGQTHAELRTLVQELNRQEAKTGSLQPTEYYVRARLRRSLIETHGAFLLTAGVEQLAEEGLKGIFTRDRVQAMEVEADLERAGGQSGQSYLNAVAKAHSRMGRLQTWLFEHHLIDWQLPTGRMQPGWLFRKFS